MNSYLINKKQNVVFDKCQSEHTEIYTGVPQGLILGPFFISIYINDLITVSHRLNFLMYADDTTSTLTSKLLVILLKRQILITN